MFNTDIVDKEIEIINLEATMLSDQLTRYGILYEAEESKPGVFHRIYDKIVELIRKITEKLKSIFESKEFEKKRDEIKDAVDKNPALGKKKFKVLDIKFFTNMKLKELEEIKNAKSEEEIENIRIKYMNKRISRNNLKAGLAIIGYTGTGLWAMKTIDKAFKNWGRLDAEKDAINTVKLSAAQQVINDVYAASNDEAKTFAEVYKTLVSMGLDEMKKTGDISDKFIKKYKVNS